MKATKRFTYQKRDTEVVKQRANQRGSDFDSIFREGVKIFKPKDGKNTVRILPPTWDKADHYGYDMYVNYGIGVNDQAYLSLSEMKKQPDPLAEARRKAERSGDKETADQLRPTKRVGMYVIDRNAEDEGPLFWPAPWTVDKAFCSLAIDEEEGVPLMVDDPEMGHDIRFYKEGTGRTTKYPAEKMRILKPSKLSEDAGLAEDWLQLITENPIPDLLNFYDYEHIAAAFDGHVRSADTPKTTGKGKPSEEDEEDAKPARNARATTRVTSSASDENGYDSETGEVTSNPLPDDEDEGARSNIAKIRARLAGRHA